MFEQPDELARAIIADRRLKRLHPCDGIRVGREAFGNFPVNIGIRHHCRSLAGSKRLASVYLCQYRTDAEGNNMPKKLDYRSVGADVRGLFRGHSEAIIAIAGFFIFVVNWILANVLPEITVGAAGDFTATIAVLRNFFEANWQVLLPNMLTTMYGGLAIYVLLVGPNVAKVGDTLTGALTLFIPYLLASVLVGWATFAGFLALVLPGLYLTGRLAVLPAVIAGEPGLGIAGSIRRSWEISRDCGWVIVILMVFTALVIRLLSGVAMSIVGAASRSMAGDGGLRLLETGVAAAFASIESVVFVVLIVAIYRQLAPQTVS